MNQVRAKKALGQHFLTDLNIARKICYSLSGGEADKPATVLEVGCGMGVLTQFLLQRDDVVTYGAEIDGESVEYLHEHYPDFAPRLIEGDLDVMAELALPRSQRLRRFAAMSCVSRVTVRRWPLTVAAIPNVSCRGVRLHGMVERR